MTRPVRLPLARGGDVYVVPSSAVVVFDLADHRSHSFVAIGPIVGDDTTIEVALPAADVVALLWPDEPAAPEVDPRVWRLIERLADACDECNAAAHAAIFDGSAVVDRQCAALTRALPDVGWTSTAATLRSLLPVRR